MGKTLAQARLEIENLPTHTVGGYEWECYSCHYHFKDKYCNICNKIPSPEQLSWEYDEKGNECTHEDLIDRKLVLKLMGADNG